MHSAMFSIDLLYFMRYCSLCRRTLRNVSICVRSASVALIHLDVRISMTPCTVALFQMETSRCVFHSFF